MTSTRDPSVPPRRVCLWNLEGAAAIILERSGLIYTNQTCGHVCAQPEEEGILVPFNDNPPLDAPELAVWRRLSDILLNAQFLSLALADSVDAALAVGHDTRCATVDRTRLRDSHEAWVYVDIAPEPEGMLQGFGNVKAVLTWPNSD